MLTHKLNIAQTPIKNKEEILRYQKLYSVGHRKLYNNMDLSEDESFIKEMLDKYVFTAKNYEYLLAEVNSRIKKEESIKENKREEIEQLKSELKEKSQIVNGKRNIKKIITLFGKIF